LVSLASWQISVDCAHICARGTDRAL
jgi:hypothetical protein